jgi:hypothetical protein
MDAKFETPHIIDGAKSPIHCLMLEMKKSSIPMKYHYHEYIELLFSIDTDAEVYVDGVGYKFLPGDLAVINSGEAHGIKFFKNSKPRAIARGLFMVVTCSAYGCGCCC